MGVPHRGSGGSLDPSVAQGNAVGVKGGRGWNTLVEKDFSISGTLYFSSSLPD